VTDPSPGTAILSPAAPECHYSDEARQEGDATMTSTGADPLRRRERILRILIPAGGLLAAIILVIVGVLFAPANGAEGFQLQAEAAKACFGLAASLVTVAFVAFLISDYAREADRRQAREDRERAREESARAERHRLVGELRNVHHAVKTSQLRMNAQRSARTYGQEMRDAVMPAVAQLGGVFSDVKAHSELFVSTERQEEILTCLNSVGDYLKALTEEFTQKYLMASRLQEADDSLFWRDHVERVRPDRTREFPSLATLLADGDDHVEGFSKPLRCAVRLIEGRELLPRS
jgi:hypothetical protein